MLVLMIVVIFLVFLAILLSQNESIETVYNYTVKRNIMTETERKFCKTLKTITDKYNMIIIPQVQLQSIFKASKEDVGAFNKIKSKSIDFAIVDSEYNYKLFIELDDYTHNYKNRIERDNFINSLFKNYNLKLLRIKVSSNYNFFDIENAIKESL